MRFREALMAYLVQLEADLAGEHRSIPFLLSMPKLFGDGFVLVGSVAGQRYWSTLLPTDSQSVTAAT